MPGELSAHSHMYVSEVAEGWDLEGELSKRLGVNNAAR